MNWIKVSDGLPPVSSNAGYYKKNGISDEVLTHSSDGLCWARYYYDTGTWIIERGAYCYNRRSTDIGHWAEIELPKD